MQEDALSNPNSPMSMTTSCSPVINLFEVTRVVGSHIRHSLIDKMNKTDVKNCDSDSEPSSVEAKPDSVTATPSRG